MSKRKRGFLTIQVAKRLKVPKALERYINGFLLTPRKQYAYIHQDLAACYYGTRIKRPLAMRLIVAAIEDVDDQGSLEDNMWSINEVSKCWMNAKRYGAKFSTSQKVIVDKDLNLSWLLFYHIDHGTWQGPA